MKTHDSHINYVQMYACLHTGPHSLCLILTPSYLLIGKVDRRREGWVKAHLVINSRSETKTHFMDQCLHSSCLSGINMSLPDSLMSLRLSLSLCHAEKTHYWPLCASQQDQKRSEGNWKLRWFLTAKTTLDILLMQLARCIMVCCPECPIILSETDTRAQVLMHTEHEFSVSGPLNCIEQMKMGVHWKRICISSIVF